MTTGCDKTRCYEQILDNISLSLVSQEQMEQDIEKWDKARQDNAKRQVEIIQDKGKNKTR